MTWNSLPDFLWNIKSFERFKLELKTHLFKKEFYLDIYWLYELFVLYKLIIIIFAVVDILHFIGE